jgi:hypothetical protein
MKRSILFFGISDFANACHRFARSLNAYSDTFTARVVVTEPHPYQYQEDIAWTQPAQFAEVEALFRACDVLCLATSDVPRHWLSEGGGAGLISYDTLGRHVRNKPLCVRHPGYHYRAFPAEHDQLDRECGVSMRLFAPDLYRFASGPLDVPYLHCPDVVLPTPQPQKRPVLLHSPSNRDKKGSADIEATMSALSSDVWDVRTTTQASAQEAHAAKALCGVYIDQMIPTIGGFGASSIEAMACGAVALASMNNLDPSLDPFWPRPPIINVENQEQLRAALLALEDPAARIQARQRSWQWFRDHATPQHCAARLDRQFGQLLGL